MSTHSGTKRILIIDFMYPLPENIGRRMRTMNFVRFFRKYGAVDLLYFYRESEEVEDKEVFRKEYYIRHPSCDGEIEKSWNKKVTGRLSRFLEKRPWMITEWPPQAAREYISIINNGNYDIIFCRYILETSPLFQLPLEQRKRVVLDYDDIFSDSLYGYHAMHDEKISSRVKAKIQKHFLFNYEKNVSNSGSFCLQLEPIEKKLRQITRNTMPSSFRTYIRAVISMRGWNADTRTGISFFSSGL